jgi:hypothetical protein
MKERKSFLLLFSIIILYLYPVLLLSQDNTPHTLIGIKGGYSNTYSDEKIGAHPAAGLLFEIPVDQDFAIQLNLEYFETNKNSNGIWKSLDYRGTTYKALTPYIWQDISLGLNSLYAVFDRIRIGLGMSLDGTTEKKTRYTKENPFYIDDNDNIILKYKEDLESSKLHYGILFLADYSYNIYSRFHLFSEFQYKLTFVGKEHSDNYFNSMNMFTFFLGIKYGL